MAEQLLDPVPLVRDPGNRAELAGRQRRRNRDLRHGRRLHTGRRAQRAIRSLDRPEGVDRLGAAYLIGETELHRLGAVGDRAAANRRNQIGPASRAMAAASITADAGVRRHMVEQSLHD